MIGEKDWYYSKTIWGSLAAILAAIGSAVGLPLDAGVQAELADAFVRICGAIGALVAIYGRISAIDRIR